MGHPHFYGCLNQQYIEKNCAAQARSICVPSAWHHIPSEQQAGGGHPSGGLSCLYKHGFGVDVRPVVPSVVLSAMVSLLQLSDAGTVGRGVMGISYWNGFYSDILSTFSTCRWIPCTILAAHPSGGFQDGCQACTEGGREYEAMTKRQSGVNFVSSVYYVYVLIFR